MSLNIQVVPCCNRRRFHLLIVSLPILSILVCLFVGCKEAKNTKNSLVDEIKGFHSILLGSTLDELAPRLGGIDRSDFLYNTGQLIITPLEPEEKLLGDMPIARVTVRFEGGIVETISLTMGVYGEQWQLLREAYILKYGKPKSGYGLMMWIGRDTSIIIESGDSVISFSSQRAKREGSAKAAVMRLEDKQRANEKAKELSRKL